MRIAIILLLVLGTCWQRAEAEPVKRVRIKLAIVGDSINWCDASVAWSVALARLHRDVLPRRTAIHLIYDRALAMDRLDLLSLESFWDGDLMHWVESTIGYERRAIRLVLLPPIINYLPMYGGMASRVCDLRGLAFVNAEPAPSLQNASVIGHEIAHLLGAADHCDETKINGVAVAEKPHMMCWKYAAEMKSEPSLGYDWLAKRQIRKCYGKSTF